MGDKMDGQQPPLLELAIKAGSPDPEERESALRMMSQFSIQRRAMVAATLDMPTRLTALKFGIKGQRINDAQRIRRGAIPEVVAAVESEEISMGTAEFLSKLPKGEQAEKLAQLKEVTSRDRNGRLKVNPGSITPVPEHRPRRAHPNAVSRLLDSIAHEAEVLAELPVPATKQPEWIEKIGLIMRSVARFI
jgi:hypothetical protein